MKRVFIIKFLYFLISYKCTISLLEMWNRKKSNERFKVKDIQAVRKNFIINFIFHHWKWECNPSHISETSIGLTTDCQNFLHSRYQYLKLILVYQRAPSENRNDTSRHNAFLSFTPALKLSNRTTPHRSSVPTQPT